MKNIKASLFFITMLIAFSSDPVVAANIKERHVPTSVAVPADSNMTHQEIVSHLLIGEMSLQRDMPETTLDNFLKVAKATKDPEVAQLATEIAIQLQDSQKALTASEIWANAAPEDIQAQLVAVTLFINADPTKAQNFLQNAFNTQNPDLDQHLLVIVNKLSEQGQKNLSDIINKIADSNATNAYAQLAAAQLAAIQLNITEANKRLNAALKIKPDLTNGIELNAKLIRHEKNDDKPALAYLEQQVNKYPKNSDLRMFYVTALTDNNMTAKAIPQLQTLSKDKVYGGDALIMLGEIYIIENKVTQAEATIKQALKFENSADKASYYLGQMAEYNNKNTDAIGWYENVSELSEYHIPAYLRAAYLYSSTGDYTKAMSTLQNSSPNTFSDQKQILLTEIDVLIDAKNYDEALNNANEALAVLNDDVDFLYARSVTYGLMHKDVEAEKDLRAILELDSNNANALNALGFTLANQPAKIAEAKLLLEKAISLNPDNPAFMDSMGWLLFKMGKNQEAIQMLTDAYKLSGDNEIAAHLGEVLWNQGNKDAAKDVWKKALLSSAINQEAINNTLTRLNVTLTDVKKPALTKTTPVKAKAASN